MEGDLNFQPSLSRYAKPNLKQPRHYREGGSLVCRSVDSRLHGNDDGANRG